ncbi:MAG: CPBP family intramembrane glutamic endopeptidase [Casimicrobiaceae bacterium]
MVPVKLSRTRVFWVGYVVLALGSLVVAWQLFPLAIPLLNLDIQLSRSEAIAQATAISARLNLAPDGARSAARFAHDQAAQNYIELDGGGKPAFARILEDKAYAPFWWEVRLFKPGVVDEVTVRYRPDGTADGFARRVPETYVRAEATKALDADTGRALAEAHARSDWGGDFTSYAPLEQAQQTRQTGRVDHTFVYEHRDRYGDARIRLRLVVAGDELIGIAPYMYVPEAFSRRFAEMRSANENIAGAASISAGLLYGLGGVVFGTFWLLRKRWLLWKPALVAGGIVGALLGLTLLAAAPAAWFGFDTAQQADTFWIRQIGAAVVAALAGGVAYGLAFMAAESLTRRAFPHHPQLWRLWSRAAAGTPTVAGRTVGGYLFVPIELALIAAFYYATNRWLGWWQPSEALTDPNILSSAVPALMPIALSLQAGFMEECVFRAIPLSLGALLGERFGRRNAGIAVAFVLQAIIFAAAHASYPGFPAYSRLVELIVPSLIWGAIFLRYGLLPTVLLHVLFDLVLFSLPLFLLDAPGAWVQRALVIAAALVPLAVVWWRRVQNGGFSELPESLWNRAWHPGDEVLSDAQSAIHEPATVGRIASYLQRALPVLAILGALAWVAFTPFRTDVPPLALSRQDAEAAASAALAQRGVNLTEWRRFAIPSVALEDSAQRQWHGFVWREVGRAAYRALVGDTLAPPLWEVRFARFDGDVAERVEEWRVSVTGDAKVRQIQHRLPEARAGANLERDAGLAIAQRTLRDEFGLDPAKLILRTADQRQRPQRTDWAFVFANPDVKVAPAEARLHVTLAGDEVVASGHSLFVPETWQRTETEREGRNLVFKIALALTVAAAGLAALVFAVVAFGSGRSDRRAFRVVVALTFGVTIIQFGNAWPSLAMGLRTAEPVIAQVALAAFGALVGGLVIALAFGLIAGVASWSARRAAPTLLAGALPPWALGSALAVFAAGLSAAFASLASYNLPTWPGMKHLASAWPWLDAIADGLVVVVGSVVVLFLFAILARITASFTRRWWIAALLLVALAVAGALVETRDVTGAVFRGLGAGLATFLFLWLVMRYDLRTVPAYVTTAVLLDAAHDAAQAGGGNAWVLFALTAAVAIGAARATTRYIGTPLKPSEVHAT